MREERREKREGEKEGWITLRSAVMRCAVLCCGQYICCSKPLTFHNNFAFFFQALLQLSNCISLHIKYGLTAAKVLETATRSKKKMKSLYTTTATTHNNTRRRRQRETERDRKKTEKEGERKEKMKDERQEKTRRGRREDQEKRTEDQDESEEKKVMMCCVWLCGFDFSCFFVFEITRHSNNYEFSKLPLANSESDNFPAIFNCGENDKLQIKVPFKNFLVILLAPR